LSDQFATSRREFEFEDDDEPLEPAPVLSAEFDDHDEAADGSDRDDGFADAGDEAVRRLLQVDEEALDYYTLLGLAREPPPTVSQIRAAYHRLSLAFHPDKQPHYLKAAAQKYFTRLQKAYETLIEPRKRVIYDLEGEEGVQNEYKPGGAMGKGGEGERRIGVKTMSAAEFKKWFMAVLMERERRGIAELVGSSSTCKLLLNARNIFSQHPQVMRYSPIPNENLGDLEQIELPAPLIVAESIQLRQSFTVPMPGLGTFLSSKFPSWHEVLGGRLEAEPQGIESRVRHTWEDSVGPHVPKLTFVGTIAGKLEESMAINVGDEESSGKTLPPPQHWYTLDSGQIQLTASLDHTFPELAEHRGSSSAASLLQGTDVNVSAGLFPKHNLSIGLGRAFTFWEDTRPYYVHVQSLFNQSPRQKPPVVDVRVSRALGEGQTVYIRWGSGDFAWPLFLLGHRLLPLSDAPLWLPRGRMIPNLRIGHIWAENGARLISTDEEEDMHVNDAEEPGEGRQLGPTSGSANRSWHLAADASPYEAKLSLTWGRDVFRRSPQHPVPSRIMKSGEAIPRPAEFDILSPRGVRLEIEGELGIDASFGGVIRGVRRVGDFTTAGIGVGLNTHRGLYISFSWSRLGQNLILPVVLFNQEEFQPKWVFWAVAFPWATYAAVEFIVIRPRLRQKRRRLIEQRRKELRETMIQRRVDAEQATLLMAPLVEHRQTGERERGGLVILSAQYGVRIAERGLQRWKVGEVADVTVAMAALVDEGQLSLPKSLHKSQIIGVWNPAPLKKKHLIIDYLFHGKRHHVEIAGNESLTIPLRRHEV
jgi:DnaJ family protein C protein 11